MPAKTITDAFVRTVKLPNKFAKDGSKPQRQIAYIDTLERGLALVLVVSYGGSKTFRAMTYTNGKAQTYKLGTYPQMTVKEARAKAREYWTNPERFEAKAESGTFKEVSDNWIKRHVEHNGLISRPEIERNLKKYVLPKWKDRKFIEIRRKDVNTLLDHIVDNHGRVQADVVLTTVRGICTWYQSRDEDYVSPIVRGMKRSNAPSRKRILSEDELRTLWKVNDRFGSIIKVALLTAQRRSKVAGMKREEVKDGVWTVDQQEREKGTGGALKLPTIALDIINRQPIVKGNPYIFASAHGKHFNSFGRCKQQLDGILPDMPHWTPHDLRRTARSLMSRAGVTSEIAERVLGHVIPGVEGIYDRYEYFDEKADALNKLAALIQTIVNPPKGNTAGKRAAK